MSLSVDAPQEEFFRLAVDFFSERQMKVLESTPHHYIMVGFGSWTSLSFGSGKGEVEVDIEKKDGGSRVSLDFDFSINYVVYFLIAIVSAFIVYAVLSSFVNAWASGIGNFLIREDYLSKANLYIISGTLILFFLGILVSVIEVSMTRKRFMREFNLFAKSLTSKRLE